MLANLLKAAETSVVQILAELYRLRVVISRMPTAEQGVPMARRISDIRKSLEAFPQDAEASILPAASKKPITPTPANTRLCDMVSLCLTEIEQRFAGLLQKLRGAQSMEEAVPLARIISDIRSNLTRDPTSPTPPMVPSPTASPPPQAVSHIAASPPGESGSSVGSTFDYRSLRGAPSSAAASPSTSPPLQLSMSADDAQVLADLRILCLRYADEIARKLDGFRGTFAGVVSIEVAVQKARILSVVRRCMDKLRHELLAGNLGSAGASGLPPPPDNASSALRELYKAVDQALLEILARVNAVRLLLAQERATIDDLHPISRQLKEALSVLDGSTPGPPGASTGSGGSRNSALSSSPGNSRDIAAPIPRSVISTTVGSSLPSSPATGSTASPLSSVDAAAAPVAAGSAAAPAAAAAATTTTASAAAAAAPASASAPAPAPASASASAPAAPAPAAAAAPAAGAPESSKPKPRPGSSGRLAAPSPKKRSISKTGSSGRRHISDADAAKHLEELNKVARLAMKEVQSRLEMLQESLNTPRAMKTAIPLARMLSDIRKPLERFPGQPPTDQDGFTRKSGALQDNFIKVVNLAIADIMHRFASLEKKIASTKTIEASLPLARILSDVRTQLDLYLKKHAPELRKRKKPAAEDGAGGSGAATPDTSDTESSSRVMTADGLARKTSEMQSLESIIADMRVVCQAVGAESMATSGALALKDRLETLRGAVRRDEAESKECASQEKEIVELQSKISEQTIKRHVLTLAVRNYDRKINLLVKTQQTNTQEELEEVFQFFDQSSQEENPLGHLKDYYERFVYFLRTRPEYVTGTMQHLSFSEMDTMVQTITQSLYSDLFLSREEILLLRLMKSIMYTAIEDCTDISNYLRGNSYITKLLVGYTKRHGGKVHLIEAFKDPVTDLLSGEDELELNPSQIANELRSKRKPEDPVPSEEEEKKLVEEVQLRNKNALQSHCGAVLKGIISNLRSMPFGIRWIAKELTVMAKSKFTDIDDKTLCLLVGSFVFLRYLTPAVITPEPYGIVTTKQVTGKQRRQLVLIGKVLQNLANDVPFGGKEYFMEPMNEFLQESREIVFDYFRALINVSEPEEFYGLSLENQPSSIQQTVTISPNELFTIHRLVVKHHTELIKGPNDPMVMLLMKMGPPQDNLPRKKNKYLILDVTGHHRDATNQGELALRAVKDQLTDLLMTVNHEIKAAPDDVDTILEILDAVIPEDDDANGNKLEALQESLQSLPEAQIPDSDSDLIAEVEKELHSRTLYRSNLTKEVSELKTALEHQNGMVEQKQSEKSLFHEYLMNVQKRAFQIKVANKPEKKIGPFTFSFKDLDKHKLIIWTPSLDAVKSSFSVEMSSSAPGTVHFVTRFKDFSRIFVVELSQLMDDLILKDTCEFEGVSFDLRRLISFLNSRFIS